MKVLWLNSVPINKGLKLLGLEGCVNGGGWVESMLIPLSRLPGIELEIAFFCRNIDKVISIKDGSITFIAIPPSVSDLSYISDETIGYLKHIYERLNPDIVHIFGTERPHTLKMLEIVGADKTVISLTGLVSICEQLYYGGIEERYITKKTIGDRLLNRGIKKERKEFKRYSLTELESIKKAKQVIGRTTWDKVCALQINPKLRYFHCNENLRQSFYEKKWDIKTCEKHSIFVSQGSYPLKGLHKVIEAMPLVLSNYPDARLYIAGADILDKSSVKKSLIYSGYHKYINNLIHKLNLRENVIFTGPLTEEQMAQRCVNSHVFISPSIIENESNSLSEARLMGVPSVASYVGGVIDRINHGVDGFFYPFNEPNILAYYISRIFQDDQTALQISENGRKRAAEINNREKNCDILLEIYKQIVKENNL